MRLLAIVCALGTGCTAHTPTARPQHVLAYRPSRLPDCSLEVYRNHPPANLVVLGTVPMTVGLWTPDAEVSRTIQPRACEAGATAVWLRSSGATRSIGGVQRIKEVEVLFLAPPEEEAVTETNGITAGAATEALVSVLRRGR